MKNGKVKKKNDDGMTGIITDDTGKDVVWVDRNAESNGIKETNPPQSVEYEETDLPGFGTVATNLSPAD